MHNHTATDPQIASRIQRAAEQRASYTLLPMQGSFLVAGPKGDVYTTTTCRCDCPDYTRRGIACKHVFMVRDEIKAQRTATAQQQIEAATPALLPLTPERAARYAQMERDFPAD